MISESAAKCFFPCFYNSAILICGVWHIAISIFWVQKPCTWNREYSQQNQIHLELWTKMHCFMAEQQIFGAWVFLVSLHVQHQVFIWTNCKSKLLINALAPRGSHLSSTLPKSILPGRFTASYIQILPGAAESLTPQSVVGGGTGLRNLNTYGWHGSRCSQPHYLSVGLGREALIDLPLLYPSPPYFKRSASRTKCLVLHTP